MKRSGCFFLIGLLALPAMGYEDIEVNNGGTVSGRILYTGNTVSPQSVIVTKDQETCGHEPREVPKVVTGEGGALVDAVVVVEGIEKGAGFPPQSEKLVIDQKTCRFKPTRRVLKTGETFIVRNSDPILHNIHAKQQGITIFNQGQPFQGLEFENKVEEPGPLILSCDAHSWMSSYLWVSDHPYVAFTDEKGRYEISEIPPGEYELRVWHPYLGEQSEEMAVEAGAVSEKDFEYKKRIRSRRRR